MDLNEAKIYVGTYAKYNNGSLKGAWLNLADYNDKEDFYDAVRELHADECDEDGEFQGEPMFQDWEEIPEFMVGESWISEKFWDLLEECGDWNEEKFDCFVEYCENNNRFNDDDVCDMVDNFEDDFIGYYDSEEDFAQQMAEECGEVPDHLFNYIDWESYARDMFMGGGYDYIGGAVFRCC